MAYGTKYTVEFKTTLGTSIEILFKKEGHASTSSEIILAENPLVIACGNEDELEVIRPSSAHIRLIGTSFRQYDELCTGGNRDWYVIINSGIEFIWAGFIVPSQYVEPYTHSTYVLNIIASDGLEGLKDFKYLDSGDRYIGLEDLRTIIDNCFTISGLRGTTESLDVYEALMTYEDSHTSTVDYSPLDQTQIHQEHFYDESTNEAWTCWDVITEILRPFKAILTLKWVSGEDPFFFIVEPENMLNDSITIRKGSTSPHSYDSYDTAVSLGANLVLANDNMMLKYGEQYNKAIVNYDTGVLDNVLKNGDFISEKWSSATHPLYWTKGNTPTVSRDGNAVVFTGPVSASIGYIYTRIYECLSGVKSAKFSFVYTPTFSSPIVVYYSAVTSGGLRFNPTTGGWSANSDPITINYNVVSGQTYTFEQTFEDFSGIIGANSYIEFRLVELSTDPADAATIKISNVKLELTYDDTVNYSRHIKETLTVEEDGNTDTVSVPSEYEIKCGDTGSNLTTRGIATGGFFDGSGNYTTKWKIKGSDYIDDPVNIHQLLAWKIALQHSKQFDILEGSIRNCESLYYPYPTLLSDPNNVNEYGIVRKYFPYYMEWDVKSEQSNGYWKELLYELGDELLDEWNDDGATVGDWADFSSTLKDITFAAYTAGGTASAITNSTSLTVGNLMLISFNITGTFFDLSITFDGTSYNLSEGDNMFFHRIATTASKSITLNCEEECEIEAICSLKQIIGY